MITLMDLRENLDAMPEQDLWELTQSAKHKSTRHCAEVVFPDKPRGFTTAYRQLMTYAELKEQAMRWRRIGKITSAMQNEDQCERIYNRLPDYAKW